MWIYIYLYIYNFREYYTKNDTFYICSSSALSGILVESFPVVWLQVERNFNHCSINKQLNNRRKNNVESNKPHVSHKCRRLDSLICQHWFQQPHIGERRTIRNKTGFRTDCCSSLTMFQLKAEKMCGPASNYLKLASCDRKVNVNLWKDNIKVELLGLHQVLFTCKYPLVQFVSHFVSAVVF